MLEEIRSIVRERTLSPPPFDTSPYVNDILKRYDKKVLGIFMYGSVLSQVTRTATSFPDFFVVTENYKKVFKRFSHWVWAHFLPPHIYHLNADTDRQCKYNLVSFRRFERECSHRAKDIYILGRFGKRVSLVYTRDDSAKERLVDCCLSAMLNIVPWVLRGIEQPFDEEDFTLACLNISYAGETRVEASSKVSKLFHSEKEYYSNTYPRLLVSHPKSQQLVFRTEQNKYCLRMGPFSSFFAKLKFNWFLRKSRIRGILRWPKFLLTVDNWVDIILAKIERTKGIKLHVTERQRRHPLLFGWPHFFSLIRQGAIGSSKTPPGKSTK